MYMNSATMVIMALHYMYGSLSSGIRFAEIRRTLMLIVNRNVDGEWFQNRFDCTHSRSANVFVLTCQ